MRVLQVIDSLPLAGAEVLVKDMAPRLRARGIDCAVAVLRTLSSPLETAVEESGVKLYHTQVGKLYSPAQVFPLAKLIESYDVVHVHLFPAQLWAVLAAYRFSRRLSLVTTEHNPWNARRRWWVRPLDRWMYPHYQRIACNSEATLDELRQWCPGIATKLCIIPNGIPLENFEDAQPAELAAPPAGMARLVFVARFQPQKDHATLLRALAQVPQAQLLLVGDGELRTQLEAMARSLCITDRVVFLGRRTDVAGVLKASDVYVHSTHSDGFGIAACEAMAAGLPVIASDVPGLAELVRGAGVLFPVGDDHALARELTAVLSSPQRWREMSAASQQRAKCFSIEKTVDAYVEMYESVSQPSRQEAGVTT